MENIFERLAKTFFNKPQQKTTEEDGSFEHEAHQQYLGTHFGYSGRIATKQQHNTRKSLSQAEHLQTMVPTWRRISKIPEVVDVLEDTVNSILSGSGDNHNHIPIDFKKSSALNDASKKKIIEKWDKVLSLLDWDDQAYYIILSYLVDGRQQCQVIYDEGDKVTNGIVSLKLMSPLGLLKVTEDDDSVKYVYGATSGMTSSSSVEFDEEQFVQVESPEVDYMTGVKVPYIHNAIKAINNMVNIEDSMVLVRFMKGIKLRIWNVNVGRLSTKLANQFVGEVEKAVNVDLKYNSTTGEFDSKKGISSVFQDFLFPSKNGEQTSVDVVDGDTALLEGTDHELFMKKMYKALHQPVSRLSDVPTIEYDSMDILKDEETFNKFISRLRVEVKTFLFEILRRELVSTGIIKDGSWEEVRGGMFISWGDKSNIIQRVQMELWSKKADTLVDLKDSGIAGNVLSYETIYKDILGFTEGDIDEEMKRIASEKKDVKWEALYNTDDD